MQQFSVVLGAQMIHVTEADEVCIFWPWTFSEYKEALQAIEGHMLHLFFICRRCGRYITGCAPDCPAQHKTEEVDSCALCAKLEKAE